MASNTTPNFTSSANIGSVAITAGNTASDGSGTIGTNLFLLLTAGANDTYVDRVDFIASATTANTATTATVARLFLSSQSSGATNSTNTELHDEITLPSVTAASSTSAVPKFTIPVNYRVPAGKTLLVSTHVAPAANTLQRANAIGANY